MWKAERTSTISAPIKNVWEVLITPKLWPKMDPEHYKEVTYPSTKLEEGGKGKMKAEGSPAIAFKVVSLNESNHEFVTSSGIPFGALVIVRRLSSSGKNTIMYQEVTATGPLSNVFAKLFFEKQIKGSLPAQHTAIKQFVEGGTVDDKKDTKKED